MSKIAIITKREYFSRVRKKSFIVMTLLGPVLIAAFYGLIIYLSISDTIGSDDKTIAVLDRSGLFSESGMETNGNLNYVFPDPMKSSPTDSVRQERYYGWVEIPPADSWENAPRFRFYSENSLSVQHRNQLESSLEEVLRQRNMKEAGLSEGFIDSLKTSIAISALRMNEDGSTKVTQGEVYTVIGLVLSFAIYMFIFLYGVQVMRGVIEEKTNRIVELMVSAVRPFELMMGKVLGLALVGLTQIVVWVVLSTVLISIFIPLLSSMSAQTPDITEGSGAGFELLESVMGLNFTMIVGGFLFYFIGGYLTYSALFAAVGSAVDNETDTQQFMLPITLPLVFAIALSTSVIMRDPNGSLAIWLSMIPLTSPVAMMVRIPFEPPIWQILLSGALLIGFFFLCIWVAGRIYRTGILMYGKKVSYRDLYKWLRY